MTDLHPFITPDDFAAALLRLNTIQAGSRVAVAVSGGGDSLALTLLLHEWAQKNRVSLVALTVDHGLRPDSADEAASLHRLLTEKKIDHRILHWRGDKPSTHIQEEARHARYALLYQACRDEGCGVLALAHNAEDQVETFWMRLAHGSGLDGLAAIAPVRLHQDIAIIRPVMGFTRQQLRATCARFGVTWVEDPSNANEKFLRVKLRGFEDLLAAEGLTPQRLAGTLEKLQEARQALDEMAARAAQECLRFFPEGYGSIYTVKLRSWPRDIQRRVLLLALQPMTDSRYAPGFEATDRVLDDMASDDFAGCTLQGCELVPAPEGVFVLREFAHAEPPRPIIGGAVWDQRFEIAGGCESCLVGALGENGLSQLRKQSFASDALERLLHKVKKTLPAIWQGENLVCVPHLSYQAPELPPSFGNGLFRFRGVKVV